MYQNYKSQNKFSKKDKKKSANGDNFSREDYTESVTRYYADLAKIPTLSAQEEKEIIKNHCDGDKLDEYARKRLVEGNLRFVFKVATVYRGSGVSLCELISQGNEGLVVAIDRFKPSKGFRFYCYAIWWIKAKISQYVKNQNETNTKMNADLCLNTKNEDDDEDQFLEDSDGIWSDVEMNESFEDKDYSFYHNDDDDEFSSEDDGDVADEFCDIEEKEQYKEFGDMMSILTEQESDILKMNYGIGEKKKSVRMISEQLGLTHTKVKSIKDGALLKLKNYAKNRPYIMDLFDI